MNEAKKFKAILHVTLEVHPVDQNNQCTGHIVPSAKLAEYGLKAQKLFYIEGQDLHHTLMNVKEKLEQIK